MKVLFCLVALICVSQATVFNNCGGSATEVTVDIVPCATYPCPLVRGKSAAINISFKSTVDTSTAMSSCYGKIGGFPLPFPLTSPNACETADSGLKCPLKAGQKYKFHYELPVQSYYPKLNVVVKWQIAGDDGKNLVCIEVQAVLV